LANNFEVQSEKGETKKMQIAQMRSALETDFAKVAKFGEQLPAMPDWATRRIYERRRGLKLTPFPTGIEVRSLRSIVAQRSAPATPAVAVDDDPDDQKKKLGYMLEALRLL
jgi:hypothetical protein